MKITLTRSALAVIAGALAEGFDHANRRIGAREARAAARDAQTARNPPIGGISAGAPANLPTLAPRPRKKAPRPKRP